MTEYISGEEYNARKQTTGEHGRPNLIVPAFGVLLGIFLLAAGFLGGMHYQKGRGNNGATTTANRTGSTARSGGFGGGFRNGQRPVVGTVTAISSTSISVKNDRTGATNTLSITSSTTVSNNGQTAAVSDIQTGDTVFVRADTSNTSQASEIMLNPSFGGGAPGGNGTDGSSSSNVQTQTN